MILPSIMKVFQTVAELCSGNENEIKIWIRGHNWKRKISRIVILVCDTPALTSSIILPSIIKIYLTVAELCSGNELLTPARPTISVIPRLPICACFLKNTCKCTASLLNSVTESAIIKTDNNSDLS